MSTLIERVLLLESQIKKNATKWSYMIFEDNKVQFMVYILLLVAFFVEVYLMNRHTVMLADDYSYSFIFGTDRRVGAFRDVIISQYNHYFQWGGRSIVHALAQIFLMHDKFIFDIANSIAFIALILVVYFHSVGELRVYPAILLLIGVSLFAFTPAFGQDFLWMVGSCNYLWGSLISLAYLLPFRFQLNKEKKLIKSKLMAVAYFLLGILCSWTNENVGLTVVALSLIFTVVYFAKYSNICMWEIGGVIGTLLGTIFMLAAPGNYARLSVLDDYSYIKNFFIIIRMFFSSNYLLYPLAASICMKVLSNKRTDIEEKIYIIGLLCAMFSMTFSPIFPERAKLCGLLFAVIVMSIQYSKLDMVNAKFRKVTAIIMLCLLLTNVRIYGESLRYIKQYEHDFNDRIEYILNEKNKGNNDIVVKRIIPRSRFNAAWGLDDLREDKDFWGCEV